MVQLFEMLFNAIKIYTIPLFPGHFKMCQKEYKHTHTRTQHSGWLSVFVLLSFSLSIARTCLSVYFIAFGKCEFSSIICVFTFSVFALMVERVWMCARVRVIMTLYYTWYIRGLYVMMLWWLFSELNAVCVVAKANLTIHIVDDISNEFIGHL